MDKLIKDLEIALDSYFPPEPSKFSNLSSDAITLSEIIFLPYVDGAVEEMTFNIKKDLVYDSSNFDKGFEVCEYTPNQIRGIINEISRESISRSLNVHFGGSNEFYLKCIFSFKEFDAEIFKLDVKYFFNDQSVGKTYCTLE